jgi:hypothetical protein
MLIIIKIKKIRDMSLKEFFVGNALEFGVQDIRIERVTNRGSKRYTNVASTIKITDEVTGVEYFIRCGENGWGWCAYSTGNRSQCRRRAVKQYNVLSYQGKRRELTMESSVECVMRHMAFKRKA